MRTTSCVRNSGEPRAREKGVALVVVLLMLTLALALVGGFVSMLVTDQQLRAVDRSRTQVFYAAHGGLERLTADLGNLFVSDFAPSAADVEALTDVEPVFDRVLFDDPAGGTGYEIDFPQAGGAPVAQNRQVSSGPFQGFTGLLTPYRLSVTARSADATSLSSEVRLERTLQTVAIPIFQFGIFSETDLSYFPGPNFDFGGRVHTNGNLFLATGATLNIRDRVTAVGEVIRTNLSNGWDTNVNYTGAVNVARAPGVLRELRRDEGSLIGTLGSPQREPGWTNMSIGDYNGYLRNGRTGARRLDLPFVTLGATPIDLIRRGVAGEEPLVLAQRYYRLASLRILLSDDSNDLMNLPGVTATAPLRLEADSYGGRPLARSGGNPTGAAIRTTAAIAANANNPVTQKTISVNSTAALPVAPATPHVVINGTAIRCSGKTATTLTGCLGVPTGGIGVNASVQTYYRTPVGTPLIGGWIKIELQRDDQTWLDVTQEILDLGVTGPNAACTGANHPAPNAVIRIQRLRDDPRGGCSSASPTDYWSNALYDTREANLRDAGGANDIRLGGVMHYVELDVNNLRRWFNGEIGVSGPSARSVNGYTLYFSDRRTNARLNPVTGVLEETGEYGFEDFVNPANGNGDPNGVLDIGEDVNGNDMLETYGAIAQAVAGSTAPFDAAATPRTLAGNAMVAKSNRPVFFRRALKLVNGALDTLPMPGFTVASENPVYVQGHYNANAAGFDDVRNSAAAVIADSVTLLSVAWNDNTSFASPNDPGGRAAQTTWYRMAVLSGKGPAFPQPGGTAQDFGTDGGVHNFLRYLEDWGGQQLNYRGSIASLFFHRQAVGTYKCCTTVYQPPTRGYNFDVEFLQPDLLPPFTPMFRDVNTTGFRQVIR